MKPTIRAMQVREAKDFLVSQTAEQAALEGVPLSDLEKRMMYFTEGPDAVEDPVKLNDEFEAQYGSEEYESKIARLLHHAHARVKKENPEGDRLWNDALRCLENGDHYILVLSGKNSSNSSAPRPPYDTLKLLGTALLVIALLMPLIYGYSLVADRYGISRSRGPYAHVLLPVWMQRVLIGAMAVLYFYAGILPFILKKPPMGIGKLLLSAAFRKRPKKTLDPES
jgi:hypothetical protein